MCNLMFKFHLLMSFSLSLSLWIFIIIHIETWRSRSQWSDRLRISSCTFLTRTSQTSGRTSCDRSFSWVVHCFDFALTLSIFRPFSFFVYFKLFVSFLFLWYYFCVFSIRFLIFEVEYFRNAAVGLIVAKRKQLPIATIFTTHATLLGRW
jgi:hypothetical protein